MPSVTGVLETALYVADLERAAGFYKDLFGFETLLVDDRLHALSVADRQVLLLFKQGASRERATVPGGSIPPHDGSGRLHMAFAIAASELSGWTNRLQQQGIQIESTVHPQRGGTSIYFRDPDSNLRELATPGLWKIY